MTLDQAFNGLSISALASVAGVTALVEIFSKFTGSLVDAGKASVMAYSNFEMLENGLTNMLRNMGEGANAGSQLFEELRKFSLETTFGVDTLASASQQLLTVGVSTDILKDKLKELGNISGGNTEKFNRLIEVYTKIKATGKATGIQINQLSMLTGVSFVQALGKTNATAEELDEVFKQLTTDGGMFAGAMDSINDTIGGKMEFVTSTWTEFLASFGELSGLADTTKSALDTIYNVLQVIVDKMNEWNDNPIMQSIIRGVLFSAITAITVALGTGLVTALGSVATQLGIIKVLSVGLGTVFNPMGLALAGVTAGVVALGFAINTANKKQQEEIEKTTQKYRDQLDVLRDLTDAEILRNQQELRNKNRNEYTKEDLINESAYGWYEEIIDYDNKLKELERDYLEFEAIKEGVVSFDEYAQQNEYLTEQKNRIDELKSSYDSLSEQLRVYNAFKAEEARLSKQANETYSNFSGALKTANEWYADTTFGKIENLKKQIDSYKEALYSGYDILVKLGNGDTMLQHISPTTEQIARGEEYINYLEEELSKLNAMANGEATKTWREYWKEVTGVNVQGLKGASVADKTTKELEEVLSRKIDFGSLIGTTSLEVYNETISEIESMLTKLGEETGIDDIFNTTDASIQGLVNWLNELKQTRDNLQNAEDEKARKENEDKYINDLNNELVLYKSLIASGKNRLQIEREIQLANAGISEERKAEADHAQKMLDLEKARLNGLKAYGEELKNQGKLTGDVGMYSQGTLISSSMDSINGTDLGTFAQSLEQTGNVFMALMETVINAFFKVLAESEAFEKVSNIFTKSFEKASALFDSFAIILEPIADVLIDSFGEPLQLIGQLLRMVSTELSIVFKLLSVPIQALNRMFGRLAEVVSKVSDTFVTIMKRWFSWLDDFYATEEQKKTDYSAILDQLKKIKDAIKESEEYYLAQKQLLNGQSKLESMQVNDMILTDKGVFSTSPQDTIIAMKHPENLVNNSSANVTMNVKVENYSTANVETERRTNADGTTDLIVKISEKIASDFAKGANGWDSAILANNYRLKGRSVNI